MLLIDPPTTADQDAVHAGDEIAATLSRQNVSVSVLAVPSGGTPVGTVLLNQATEFGADMLVMGAYGHSRLRQLILGGATRQMLGSMSLPVFMSR